MDLQSAYDTVWHEGLYYKLKNYIKWMEIFYHFYNHIYQIDLIV
jgi:hypothetical protein